MTLACLLPNATFTLGSCLKMLTTDLTFYCFMTKHSEFKHFSRGMG